MGEGAWLVLFVTLQRVGELALARRNTRHLLARGGHEHGRKHYPVMVAFHTFWLAVMAIAGWNAALSAPWVAVFVLLQILRVWTIASLGHRWTTRIVTVPDPLVRRGPYRFLRHPNYVVVAGEIAAVPLALGMPWAALGFSVAHAFMLRVRLLEENRALAETATARPAVRSAGSLAPR